MLVSISTAYRVYLTLYAQALQFQNPLSLTQIFITEMTGVLLMGKAILLWPQYCITFFVKENYYDC